MGGGRYPWVMGENVRGMGVVAGVLWLVISAPGAGAQAPVETGAYEGGALFEEAWATARDRFLDAEMKGVDWDGVRDRLAPRAREAGSRGAEAGVVNEALAALGTSHTRLYTAGERAYWELLDIFNPDGVDEGYHERVPPGRVAYEGLGLVVREVGGRVFASGVYEAGPAARAGVLVGDEVVSVDGAAWRGLAAFVGRAGGTVGVEVRREAGGETATIPVDVEWIQPREMFLASLRAGARVFELEGNKIAHVRVRSYAHPDYHEAVKELVLFGELSGADALVLDLRGGWGGADPGYLELFNPIVPRLVSVGRGGERFEYGASWRKPLVVLIDGGTRSGKEILAWAIKRHGVGTLVGERTAGAVVGGSPIVMADGSVLYLAVRRALVDGEVLEGVGVAPDVEVGFTLEYAAGRDPQLARAVEVAAGLARAGDG